jgi:choline/glycine/proline betaine transport protein
VDARQRASYAWFLLSRLEQALGLRINPPVFWISAGLIAAFVLFGAILPDTAQAVFGAVQSFIAHTLGWLYNASMTLFLFFCAWLALSRFGKIRLGADDERPSYSYLSWFAMLFSAGMGIGVLFWSVAEPVTHYLKPPTGVGSTPAAAQQALEITLLHWGLHGWSVYVIVGLSLAYFSFRKGLPLTLRSALSPLLGRHTEGPLGHAVDIFAVLGTMFGVATTLGMGSQQVNAGLQHLLGVESSTPVQLIVIAIITAMATVSVVSGLDRGIRRLSELNVGLAVLLLLYVLIAGPTVTALQAVAQGTGSYLLVLAKQGFWSGLGGDLDWQSDWTLFYWGWWIAWSPFVGMFVARISRGRTIREFVLGVMFVPTAVTCVWFAIFGSIALERVQHGYTALSSAVQDNYAVAIYVFFDSLPLSGVVSVVAVLVVVTFFVTSSDSASLVIDYITADGNDEPPVRQRVFWATAEGAVAAVLLLAGGLAPMRSFQIATGLPLCVILLLMCYALVRALLREGRGG